ncbi:MAG: hypothetical protein P0Y49_10120 [Candidatus Pedobacter colombiensis]|uniref:Uncharacterized protein n=1 Tax=Candidatus Pedobacter colombiensis TaxID=3121371 RepID=A0AAJ5WF96_9SPHI|nr:hypothetical protein [Pedobacter sp.]WEK21492.1 MAG: hypothetical protein P0Y49_10120 [Pedobacter sp.]
MPITRTIVDLKKEISVFTYMLTERTFQSSWNHPNVPVLVFADSALPGFSVDYHGGSVGSGMPVELLFWGDWWNTAEGSGRRILIETRVQAVLASDYFSELKQYGVDKPYWRGARIVTNPSAPSSFSASDDIQAVPDLIDDLIDDNVFPDPDDEKIAFVVFMPKGFTQSIGELGSHTKDYNYTFPWDVDWYWVAWVMSFGDVPASDPEDVIGVFTHELVEMLTDPESDGWYANNPEKGEIGDAAVIGGDKLPKLPGQTAWVNGAHVTAYFSNQYGANVIPIDRDYKARILGTIGTEHKEEVSGMFRPDPAESRLCDLLPQCCFDNREYKFTITKRNEMVHLSVETQRYREPKVAWIVEGNDITADVTLSLNVLAGVFVGRVAKSVSATVLVHCTLANNELTLRTIGTESNFDIMVSCRVTDASIRGKVRTNVIAKPFVQIGFVGVEISVDPEYTRQLTACIQAATKMFKDLGKTQPSKKIKKGDPIEFDPQILNDIPAYARVDQYERAKRVLDISRIAHRTLPLKTAQALTASLVLDVPSLQIAMDLRFKNKESENRT